MDCRKLGSVDCVVLEANTPNARGYVVVIRVCCEAEVAEGTSFSLYVRFRTSRRRSAHLDEQKKSGLQQPDWRRYGDTEVCPTLHGLSAHYSIETAHSLNIHLHHEF